MAAATQSADSETMRALDQLEVKLTSVLDSLSTINEATTNFNDSQQQPLFEHIQKFQHQLKDLQDLPLPETIQVPLGALDYMDKASNPNLFWRDILRETTATVDANRGKALTLKTLRDNLAQEVAVLQSAKSEPLKPRPLPVLNPEAFDELPMEITEASMAAAAALNEDGSNAAATSMSTNGSALGNANHAASQASTGGANQSNSRSIPGRLDMPNPGEQYEWAQCDICDKWRRLPSWKKAESLPESWQCKDNNWSPLEARCSVPQENEFWLVSPAEGAKPT